mgnify:FL=1
MNHTYEKCGCGEVHVSTRPETPRYVDGTGQLWYLHCFLRALEERLNKLDGAADDRSLVDRVTALEDKVTDVDLSDCRYSLDDLDW